MHALSDKHFRRITLHQYGGPVVALMLDLQCGSCKARVAHDTVTPLKGKKTTMAVASRDALVLSTSAETAFATNLVADAHGFMVRAGATIDALAAAYNAHAESHGRAGAGHLQNFRADLLGAMSLYTLGHWMAPRDVPSSLGNHGDQLDALLCSLRPAWEAQFRHEWVGSHGAWCHAPGCGSVVCVDANLKTTSHQCAAVVDEVPVLGTSSTTPVFCGSFTLGQRAQTCTGAACLLQREELATRLQTRQRELSQRHEEARAAARGEGRAEPAPVC